MTDVRLHNPQRTEKKTTATRIQKLVFLRHGVAKHNLLDPMTGQRPVLEDPKWFDPPLVYEGKQQAVTAGEKCQTYWKTTQGGEKIQLVLTSPLTRCIQTSMYAFLPGSNYTTAYAPNQQQQQQEPNIVCCELIREAYGQHFPDRRRNISTLAKHWRNVNFDTLTESDELWKMDKRETMLELQERVQHFFQNCLVQRSETNIVVVSHGVWIEVCLNLLCPSALEFGNRRVYNCDMFAGECISTISPSTGEIQFERLQNFHLIR